MRNPAGRGSRAPCVCKQAQLFATLLARFVSVAAFSDKFLVLLLYLPSGIVSLSRTSGMNQARLDFDNTQYTYREEAEDGRISPLPVKCYRMFPSTGSFPKRSMGVCYHSQCVFNPVGDSHYLIETEI